METIQEALKINFIYLFLSVFTILTAVKTMASLFEWVFNKLGLETKWKKKQREEHSLLMQTSRNLAELQKLHKHDIERSDRRDGEIADDIKKLTGLVIEKQINDFRWEILNLADKISNGGAVSRECYRHAIATYEKYQKIINEHGLVNGEVEISIGLIRDTYQAKLKEGF